MGTCTSGICSCFGDDPPKRPDPPMRGNLILKRNGALKMLPNNDGKKPSDKYTIGKAPIGEGAYGSVRKVTPKGGAHIMALKQIRKESVAKKPELFQNEVEINASLDHPNITKLYETFEDQKYVYLALELCHGGEMFDAIIENGHFGEKSVATMMVQILRAVAYMHSCLVCHRDLKPENFLLYEKKAEKKEDRTIKIIDFGIAKRYTQNKGVTVPMTTKAGTAYYVAPEILVGSYNEKVDVWSCGVIMYILLSGSPPFSGSNDAAILKKVKTSNPSFKQDFQYVSAPAIELIKMMLNRDVEKRPSATDALNNSWTQKTVHDKDEVPPPPEFFKNLKAFGQVNEFKKKALHVIAHRLDDSKIKLLRENFIKLDTDGDGQLSLSEIKEGCELVGMNEKELNMMFQALDMDGGGSIGYKEFITAMIDKRLLDEEVCREAFTVFDKDGNGEISLEELQDMLEENDHIKQTYVKGKPSSAVEELFQSADTDGSGSISFKEFMDMMRNA